MKKSTKKGISYILASLFILSIACMPKTVLAQDNIVLKNGTEIQLTKEDLSLRQMVLNQLNEIRQNKLQNPDQYVSDHSSENDNLDLAIDYIEENESNDDFSTADRMYVDEGAEGYCDSESDIDFYKIKYTDYGVAEIRLSSIPSDCDYDLLIYDENYETVIACTTSGDETEYAYFYPEPYEWYYAVVCPVDGYDDSDYYRLRFKLENFRANLYAGDQGDIDTTADITYATTYLGDLDYEIDPYDQPTRSKLKDMPGASIVLLSGHGNPDHVKFRDPERTNTTYNCGVYSGSSYETDDDNNYKYVGLRDLVLSACNLMIFAACETAGEGEDYSKNIAYRAVSVADAKTSIGWEPAVHSPSLTQWLAMFYLRLASMNVEDAAKQVNLDFPDAWTDDVYEWIIYGDTDMDLTLPDSATLATIEEPSLFNTTAEVENIDTTIYINVPNKDFTSLESYLEEHVSGFSTDTFVLDENRIHDSGNNDYFLYYNYIKDGFSTPYYVVVSCENGIPDKYSFNFTAAQVTPSTLVAETPANEISRDLIDTAKTVAIENLPVHNANITNQKVDTKIDKNGNKFLRVTTTTTESIDGEEFNTVHVFDYSLN